MFSRPVALLLQLYKQSCTATNEQCVQARQSKGMAAPGRPLSPSLLLYALIGLFLISGAAYAHPRTVGAPTDTQNNAARKPIQQTIPCCATLTGTIKLQGHLDHSGIQVVMWPGSNLRATTESDGHFSIAHVPANNGVNASTYTIEVAFPGYLNARTTFDLQPFLVDGNPNVVVTFPELWLLGGDLNGDNRINIFDLVLVGSQYGEPDPTTGDINGDGRVNIQDLSIAAGNFGKDSNYGWEP